VYKKSGIFKKMKNLSCVLTIHNKEFLIKDVIGSLCKNLSEKTNQVIIVFDGCTDKSEEIVVNFLKTNKTRKFDFVYTENVFETKANNAGLKLVENDYVVLIQDDMVVNEKDFDLRMLKPFQMFDDVFAVTSFVAHNNIYNESTKQINYIDVAKNTECSRDMFYAREYANRGPLMYNYNDVVKLNFLDEYFAPQNYDDMDISMRAFKELGKVSGLYWVDYTSDPNWGTTRQKNQNLHNELVYVNASKILEKHKDLLYGNKFVENRNC
jgi:glycosyltransferase involved in cell wall biosynthesis